MTPDKFQRNERVATATSDLQGNFEFGIGRVMKSLEPYPKKLGTDTWFYAKRVFLALAETLAKHMIMLKADVCTRPAGREA
ncbi:hypothetical protein EMIHUDRAFT_232772 [Emiliania huxleyi CCMP1516]|uniref:Uncharacterized protein n=2 Tax=Emiliania huxleyi TaxID=2903 RepID=A0A0D3K4A3_EMIH1|nr:hypothetical protein EMIHUDRAFT_232772 [Emiliania huxleyi CCMP1516]EOD30588.1 hypothetical protein EMIHUDRAFT_232772 [Emiliania huxleyi CCMP1516]|eukprot:XP_005783017.1 hypothetical protein EMIHUDRAFT_232772 [Emiliania huxleyi CCMP1516]